MEMSLILISSYCLVPRIKVVDVPRIPQLALCVQLLSQSIPCLFRTFYFERSRNFNFCTRIFQVYRGKLV